jgi:CDP-diacylglycerol--serine O-phosphatidyltransferase
MRAPRLRRRKEHPRLRRGIYLIPSLFTVANIFCGFMSVAASARGQMERAAILILVAIIADILDGRIARLTGSTSSFGEIYDSLADVISFGMAPSLLAFHWGLWQVPKYGTGVAFLFLVAGSIRLARFSSRAHDTKTFDGLPIPAGAGAVAMFVLTSPTPVKHPAFIPVVAGFVLCLALLMVSNLPYRSFKDVNLRKQWPATTVFVIALAFSAIKAIPHVLSVLCAIYVLSAPVAVLTSKVRRRPMTPTDDETEDIADGSGVTEAPDH